MAVGDLSMVLSWRNHPDVRRFMFNQHEISLQEHTAWFTQVIKDGSKDLLIVEESSTPIGYVQFSHVELGGISHWGFYIRPDASKGTGQKLGIAALEHAFDKLQLHKVCGEVIASNQASIKFHERLGFTREAEFENHRCINDKHHTIVHFGLLADQWLAYKRERDQ